MLIFSGIRFRGLGFRVILCIYIYIVYIYIYIYIISIYPHTEAKRQRSP